MGSLRASLRGGAVLAATFPETPAGRQDSDFPGDLLPGSGVLRDERVQLNFLGHLGVSAQAVSVLH
jgi:hypothetical protein